MRKFILALCALGLLFGATGCGTKPQAGEIGVVRNGGPFDNHRIRQIVPNGAGYTWVGWFSSTHYYPVSTQQRYFRFATCTDSDHNQVPCKGADGLAITVPTSDGINVTIEGTLYLNTAFGDETVDPSNKRCDPSIGGGVGNCLLRTFDTQFATRTFDGEHAYDGNSGWSAFLGAMVEPIVVNNLRSTISGVTCADLVSSCALVQNQGQAGTQQVVAKAKNGANQNNVQRVQDAVQQGFSNDLDNTLGHPYFEHVKFALQRVLLPNRIENAINQAQSAFADVSQSQAHVRSAKLESQANAERQAGYLKCPTCARIDAIKALPRDLQALGSNVALGIK